MRHLKEYILRKTSSLLRKNFNVAINRADKIDHLRRVWRSAHKYELLSNLDLNYADVYLEHQKNAKSQLFQEMAVLSNSNAKKGGWFVEIGGCDGIQFSNTWLLEKSFEWQGVIVEPARCWHKALKANRDCRIDTRFVAGQSNIRMKFQECAIPELSTAEHLLDQDFHSTARRAGIRYECDTVSLDDLLVEHDAPKYIDYLSVDIEGSEFDVLSNFSWNHEIGFISCEHNYSATRERIFDLLREKGYERVFEEHSWFDDWYVRRKAIND